MSDCIMLVKFEDGEIMIGRYVGSIDLICPRLIPDTGSWTDIPAFSAQDYLQQPNEWDTDVEPVEIYSDYGAGFYWKGLASRQKRLICRGYDYPWGDDKQPYGFGWKVELNKCLRDGTPEWVKKWFEENK